MSVNLSKITAFTPPVPMCGRKHRCVGVISKLGNPNALKIGMSGEFSVNSRRLFPLEGAKVKFWILNCHRFERSRFNFILCFITLNHRSTKVRSAMVTYCLVFTYWSRLVKCQILSDSSSLDEWNFLLCLSVRRAWCLRPGNVSTSSHREGIWCSRGGARWQVGWSPTWTTVLSWRLTVTTAASASKSLPLTARSQSLTNT